MPIISSIAFGVAMPVSRVRRVYPTNKTSKNIARQPGRPRPLSVATDYTIRGLYKQNKIARLHEQYSLYNKGSIPQTVGVVVSLEY